MDKDKNNEDEQITTVEDYNVAAYMMCKGLSVDAVSDGDGKVSFVVHGKDVEKHLKEMYSDPLISRFIRCLRKVRGRMFEQRAKNALNTNEPKEERN